MEEYRELYLIEAKEILQTMEEEVLRLEQENSEEAVQRLFRAAHTLKGSSGAMGYVQTNRLTHDMEHVLDKVRLGLWEVTEELATLLFSCVDKIRLLHQEIGEGNNECSSIDDLLDSLRHYNAAALTLPRLEAPVAIRLPEEESRIIRSRMKEGGNLLRLSIVLREECEMPEARLKVIEQWLSDMAAYILPADKLPAFTETGLGRQADAAWLLVSSFAARTLAAEASTWPDVAEADAGECCILEEGEPLAAAPAEAEELARRKAANATIRVNVDRLENLMNLAGELVIEQTRLAQVGKELEHAWPGHAAVSDFTHIGDRLNRLLGELQENVMKVRMLPIEQLFNRLPRMVRDLSRSLGKEVELVLEGKETELDRTLIEELGDPLIHLIRNALDHGIEKPEERLAWGKPAAGRLEIGAYHEDSHIVIRVEDDGAGINSARLLEKAVDHGIMTREAAASCTDREALELIFHPGLSTARQVSDISGRGVGMDIVRACIEKINGLIDVKTVPGQGTSFQIRLPLTLAIGRGLLVFSGGQTFIIPMSNVVEIVRGDPDSIKTVKGLPVLMIRDRLVPVIRLHELLGLPASAGCSRHIPLVIIGKGEKRAALAVEQLIGNQEIVIKPLGNFVGQIEGVAGATILGSGKVALILELGWFFKQFGR